MAIIKTAEKNGEHRTAWYSWCEQYRYRLLIMWQTEATPLTVIGLNPSTATEHDNDPTVKRCINFAKALGFGGLSMLNAFAWRATDPNDMMAADDPVGDENDAFLQECYGDVVAAWGNLGRYRNRETAILRVVNAKLKCWGKTKSKCPRHPLYLPKSAELIDLE